MMNNPDTTPAGIEQASSVSARQADSHRILVLHSRAITQLVNIRTRTACRRFPNLAAIAVRAAHSENQEPCMKGPLA